MGLPSFGFSKKMAEARAEKAVKIEKAEKAEKERLRREDHLRVKHDKLFSDWKILVGPTNWKQHAAGDEGSQRYNTHNLPATYFGPGVYELGLTEHTYLATERSTNQRKIRRHAVLVVYLGQADNVRQRLQRYGQTGSHLEGKRPSSATSVADIEFTQRKALESVYKQAEIRGLGPQSAIKETSGEGGLQLFTEVFSRGYSIAFRWARTESKQVAEKVESELLHVFDYPWNTALNGARRPRDILSKLELLQYHLESNLCLGRAVGMGWKKWEYLTRNVGISVSVRKPMEEYSSRRTARPKLSIFVTSTKAQEIADGSNQSSSVCGVLLEDGSSCHTPPVQGRKRCSLHKGQRVQVSTRLRRSNTAKVKISQGKKKPGAVVTIRAQLSGKRVEIADVTSTVLVCGATVNGSPVCLNLPVPGRKRCSEHKGIRMTTRKQKSKQFACTQSGLSAPNLQLQKSYD